MSAAPSPTASDEWGIPELDSSMQALSLPSPIRKWGTLPRSAEMRGTYHFYESDAKFSALWKRPDAPMASGCRVLIEANYSTSRLSPRAVVLHNVYRKRWLARYWQSRGIRTVVDLNVDPAFRELNFLGIPQGWRSYAVRAHNGIDLATIRADYEAACRRAGTTDILFAVFGGHRRMKAECEQWGWAWVPEESDAARGRGMAAKEQWHGPGPGWGGRGPE